jgi:alkyl sulfatase BDS1-like metallo-beta-lactamase superfamily hydrolase
VTLSRDTLNKIVVGQTKASNEISSGNIKVDGNRDAFESFLAWPGMAMLDTFDPWYNLISL